MRSLPYLLAISLAACASAPDIEDPETDTFLTEDAKADAFGVEDWSPDGAAVLRLASTKSRSQLQNDVGLSERVAKAIVAKRDAIGGTYNDLAQLDAAPYVGKTVFARMLEYVTDHHMFKTSFRVPLIVENADNETKVSITTYNEKARSVGLSAFARYTFVDKSTDFDAKMTNYDNRLKQLAAKAHITIDGEMMRYADGYKSYVVGSQEICFIGDPNEVYDVATGQAGAMTGEMYSVWGWRYKARKWMYDDGAEQLGDDWAAYKSTNNYVLLVYTNDDDGTHLAADKIKPCRR